MTQKIEDVGKMAVLRKTIAGRMKRYELLSKAAERPGRETAPADAKDGDVWFVPPSREQQARIDAWKEVVQDLKTLIHELERGGHLAAATEINPILYRVCEGEWVGVLSDWLAVETGLCVAEERSRRGDESGESGAKPQAAKKKKRRGPKPATRKQQEEDRRIFEAWNASGHRRYEDFARSEGMEPQGVRRAVDRHRSRFKRRRK